MKAYLLVGFVALVGCNTHELTMARVAAPQSQYPVSMSDFIVVDQAIVSSDELEVVGRLKHHARCVKPNTTTNVSQAINTQVRAAGGQGVIGFGASVSATSECQDVVFSGKIVKLRAVQ